MPRRFSIIAALILLPVLVLAGVAAWGLGAQARAVRAETAELARQEADALAAALAERLAAETRQAWVRLYPAVPVPVEEANISPAYAAALTDAATDASQGILLRQAAAGASAFESTPAGLPLGPLAALEQLERAPDPEAARRLAALALHFAPSVVTPPVLERAEEVLRMASIPAPPALSAWRETWAQLEAQRAVLRALRETATLPEIVPRPLSAEGGGGTPLWVMKFPSTDAPTAPLTREGETRDVPADGQLFGVLSHDDVAAVLHQVMAGGGARLPAWAAVALTVPRDPSLSRRPSGAGGTVAESQDQTLPVIVALVEAEPGARLAGQRRLAVWAWSVVGVAVAVSALGLWLAHRTLAREQRLGELKSQFVSSVSHELRAPVGSLRLMAEGLASGKITGDGAAEFHRLMAQEGARLSSLIENVLDFARIEQGRKHYTRAETDLPALVRNTVKLLQPPADARRIALRLETPDEPFTPSVDAAALQQALVNLLDNALKFSPEGAEVIIRLVLPNQETHSWSLAVRDHGPGIPPGEHRRIFERFYRLGNELRRETQGAGIGLSLVKHIVEGHGGRVEVISEEERGSELRMVFAEDDREDRSYTTHTAYMPRDPQPARHSRP